MDESAREESLLQNVAECHAYHYERNTAYRATVAARGVDPRITPGEMPRLLRTTSQAFRSYIDVLGTPFPQDRPGPFAEWFAEQMSLDTPAGLERFDSDFRSLAALLRALEHTYGGLDLQVLTSTGACGRTALVPRDKASRHLALESLSLSLRRYLGVKADHTAIIMTPKHTRLATASLLRDALRRAGVAPERMLFTFSLPASPDQLRVRAGRSYRSGWRGAVERYLSSPALAVVQSRMVDPRARETAMARLIPAGAHGRPAVLLGSPSQLHGLARLVLDTGRPLILTPGSLLATLGRPIDTGAATPAEMRADLQKAFRLSTGEPAPVHDIYALAEANWAAMQCAHGNYHIPPWVYAVTMDDQDRFQQRPRSAGPLAFFDPLGGGGLFPAFFRTSDEVTLVKGSVCPCGESGSYLEDGSIRSLDQPGDAR